MKKNILICVITALLPLYAKAWTACGTDRNGEIANCEYQLVDGTLTIRGTGSNGNIGSWDNASYASPFKNMNVEHLVIEDTIKDLGANAFSLTVKNPIIIPSSVTEISKGAFSGVKTSEVIIPNSVTNIRALAFHNSEIKKIEIPDSVISIGAYAFYNITNLTEIIVPDSVTHIQGYAFSYSDDLKTLIIGDNTSLDCIFHNDYCKELTLDLSNIKVYCTGDVAKCDTYLETAGYENIKSIKATKKQINGVTYILDKNGHIISSTGNRTNKRIYTVEEAGLVTNKKNSVAIRYK